MALLIMTSCLCMGCGKKVESLTEITLLHGWGTMEKDHVAMRQIYQDFEKENSDIKLNLISMPSSEDVVYKAGDMLSVGQIPDLIFTGGIGYNTIYQFMVEKGYALDLMPYVKEDPDFKENISKIIFEYWTTKENKLYTLSDVLLLSGYWYNEEVLREAQVEKIPQTWDEFYGMCDKIQEWADTHDQSIAPIRLDPDSSISIFDVLWMSNGDKLETYQSKNKINQFNQEFIETIHSLKKIYNYAGSENESYTYRDSLNSFNMGKSAIYVNGVWANASIAHNIPAKYAAFPSNTAQSIGCKSACIGYVAGNSKDQKRIEASVRFLKYMLSDEVQNKILVETGQIPSSPNVNLEEYKDISPRLYQAVEAVESAKYRIELPINMWDEKEQGIFRKSILQVLNEEMDTTKFLNLLER